MIRVLLDSDRPALLAGLAPLVATYADLATSGMQAAFRDGGQELIVLDRGLGDPHHLATVADVERGALTVAQLPALLKRWKSEGRKNRTVYASRDTMPAVNNTAPMGGVYRWFATLDGTAHIPGFRPGHTPAAVQCLPAGWLGFHADLSLVFEDSWHRQAGGALPPTARADLVDQVNHLAQALADDHDMAAAILTALGKLG